MKSETTLQHLEFRVMKSNLQKKQRRSGQPLSDGKKKKKVW